LVCREWRREGCEGCEPRRGSLLDIVGVGGVRYGMGIED
jgi:hypothetical protein